MKTKKVYSTVFGLKDGTAFSALPVRNARKTKPSAAPKVDAEGVSQSYAGDEVVPADVPDRQRVTSHTAVATALNVKRILRE
jgi:hypothetical protein